ncbi:MAG TPA: hypothetical protein VF832_15165, partial [Longimicrobiales bacterium]
MAPSRGARGGIALLIGVAAAIYVLGFYGHQAPGTVSDIDTLWVAARALRAGQNPYTSIPSPPWPWGLLYPLPAVLVMLPFSLFPLQAARAVFMGVSAALLAYGLTRRAWWPLIMMAGGQMFFALQSVQWTPVFAAAVLLPSLQVLWPVKPTTGAALFAAYPGRRAVIGGVVLAALAFWARPHWLVDWVAATRTAPHRAAILNPGGVLLLLSLLRWRLPEGRQLAVLACMPLSPHLYEALPLMLVARSKRELLALATCGTIGLAAGAFTPPAIGPSHGLIPWTVVLLTGYL